ncbi:unnamed protein product, partial [Closterium sp. NIES-53]
CSESTAHVPHRPHSRLTSTDRTNSRSDTGTVAILVTHIPYPMSHVPYPVSHIPCPISRVPYPVSHIPCPISGDPQPMTQLLPSCSLPCITHSSTPLMPICPPCLSPYPCPSSPSAQPPLSPPPLTAAGSPPR